MQTSQPLQIIFSDVWTSPIVSHDGYKYYVIFVDHFTKYIWLYPLKRKSDVQQVFKQFKVIVEKFFNKTIVSFYTDNGGEYIALKSFLSDNGISHLTSPPHTPEHNGYSERRHLHIVETGLALLSHASIPKIFWTYAFSTAVYLINRMPTPTLNMSSPFESIFCKSPNFDKLKVFGCLCYPWLGPYTSHKLESKSKPCVFLGYSLSQSAYLCFDKLSNKMYISRHVQFIESVFPFQLACSTPSDNSTLVSDWLPPTIFVPSSPPQQLANTTSSSQCRAEVTSVSDPSLSSSASPSISTTDALNSAPHQPVPSASTQAPPPQLLTHHPMITRSQNNIRKPIQKLTLHTGTTPTRQPETLTSTHASSETEPTTTAKALNDPHWRKAMTEEYDALMSNGTWELVPSTGITNVVGCRWVYRIKRNPDNSIQRFKARLVAKGFHQRPGVDYNETFSPVVKPTTVRLVLSLAISKGWPLKQLDINNAFLQGHLSESVYMSQPPGFIDSKNPSFVCKLHKAIYGLKQAPRAWYYELRTFLLTYGFRNSHSDTSLFIYTSSHHILYLLVYVDDIVVTGNNNDFLAVFVSRLAARFSLKDLGNLSYFLGVEVLNHSHGLLLSQRRYITDMLTKLDMMNVKPVPTPIPSSASTISLHMGSPIENPTLYHETVGSLQYLSLTRPDVSFAVNKLAQFMHNPTDAHWTLVKRVLRYLLGTMNKGLLLQCDSPSSLHAYADKLHAFSDADWAGNKDDYSSTSAYLVYLGRNLISWSSKKQKTVARSSTEAEYRSVAATASELSWVRSLLQELGVTLPSPPVIYCDNIGATQLSANPVFHSRMKHVAVDYHFIRDQVQSGLLRVAHVSAADQLADLLTKPLSTSTFQSFRDKIGLFDRGLS